MWLIYYLFTKSIHTIKRCVKWEGVAEGWKMSWYSNSGGSTTGWGCGCFCASIWFVDDTSGCHGELDRLRVCDVTETLSATLSPSSSLLGLAIQWRFLGGVSPPLNMSVAFSICLSLSLIVAFIISSSSSNILSGGIPCWLINSYINRIQCTCT